MADTTPQRDQIKFDEALGLMGANRLAEAQSVLIDLQSRHPQSGMIDQKLGEIYLASKNIEAALNSLTQAVGKDPQNGFYHYRLGYALFVAGRKAQAANVFQQAMSLRPDLTEPYLMMATLLEEQGEIDLALEFFLKKADEAQIPEVFSHIGSLYAGKKEPVEAEKFFRKALALRHSAGSQIGLIRALLDQLSAAPRWIESHAQEACSLCMGLIQLGQETATARKLLADVESLDGNNTAAITYYRQALAEKPDDSSLHTNLGLVLLRSEEYQEGWSHLRRRTSLTDRDYGFRSQQLSGVSAPAWDGAIRPGMMLLITSEQGVGDQVLHSQHINALTERGVMVVLTCNVKLRALFQRSFPNIRVFPDNEPIPGELKSVIDTQCSIADLAFFLRIDPKIYTGKNRYLEADSNLVQRFREKYGQDKVNIGIAWHSQSSSGGLRKSIALERWLPLLANRDCQFISLQYGEAVNAAHRLGSQEPQLVYIDESVNPFDDLDKAAAQIAALDLVISVSNASVHLAGSLGVPTWVLLPKVALWHWFEGRGDSPWYPSVRLFRQRDHNDWNGVFDEVCEALQNSGFRKAR